MEKAYFSGIRNRIIPCLDNATQKIQVAMAWFTSNELFEALINALNRDVDVELILLDNAINYMYYAPDFNEFINAGGKLRIAGAEVGFMHHKFCVIDDSVAITGSYNWTYYAETRNVENIVISDNSDIVMLFSAEFQRLQNLLSVSSSCARLSWDDIEQRDDVDYRELNYEIEQICEVQNKPVKRFFETKTEVVRTEIKKTAFAKYAIGIQVLDDNGRVSFNPFITSGTKLPYHSKETKFFYDSKNMKEFPCLFIYGNPNNVKEWNLIKEADLMQVAMGTSDVDLPIKISMSLDDNGSLRVDVSCAESGQKLTISTLDSKLVKYE